MPIIINVSLNIQHGGPLIQPPILSPRTVTVTFTSIFNQVELLAKTVFRADVKLISQLDFPGETRTLTIGTAFVQASNATVQTTLSRVLTRGNLDEDPDRLVDGRKSGGRR